MGSEEKVFIPHLTECWAPAISSGNNSFKLLDPCDVLTTEELKSVKYDKTSWGQLKALPMLSTLPAFENAASVYSPIVDPLEGKDNIAELQFVSEASVVHSIRCRYKKDLIYTDVGRIVIALNPFQSRPDLYNDAQISRYGNADSPYTLSPHVYQIAAGAYKGVMDDGINQSTLITGESGIGTDWDIQNLRCFSHQVRERRRPPNCCCVFLQQEMVIWDSPKVFQVQTALNLDRSYCSIIIVP